MAKISVEVDREDLMALIKGTDGPGSYSHPFDHIGKITGFPNERWQWDLSALENMSDEKLLETYYQLKEFKTKN